MNTKFLRFLFSLVLLCSSAQAYNPNSEQVILSPFASNATTSSSIYSPVGGISFSPTGYSTIKLYSTGYVTTTNCTMTTLLRNLTDATDVASITTNSTTTTFSTSSALTLPTASKTYEIRIKITGASCGASDAGILMAAGFQFS